ncbi:M23 family metallopeptidase [Marinilabilia rubra]|uniref:M23 family peptidase n=1 Tax=Marinilabilia rubra TaxID=2162893 RepID=A0A2U2BBZ1_9BACT|nr:M23 family metallopeptidase [Marinilabilia rubra]PWE00580.1 M23 family peptidase [Marinilabilia rubra]
MNRRGLFYLGFLFIFQISCFTSFSQQPPVQWEYQFPLDISPKVSGSFGELRSNHFHSGLDLTTKGKTGLPVYAADMGFVSRVAVSPYGFGKAVYVDHPSGYTTVYAHLDGFSEKIDSVVTAIQYDQQSFQVNEYLDEGLVEIERGEIIGFSGNSGSSGGPHLHFEVRETEGQRPLDPLAFPNPVKDDVRPHIAGIKIYPLSDSSTINGHHQAQYYPAVFYDGAFHLKHNPSIETSGIIGVGIEVIDYYTGSWRKCGVHSIDLNLNDEKIFSYLMDGFYFHNTRYLNSHIDYAEKVNSGRVVQKSFLDPLNRVDLYEVDVSRGKILTKARQDYDLSFEVKDVSGNSSNLDFTIQGVNGSLSPAEDDPSSIQIQASEPFLYDEAGHSVSFEEETFYQDVTGQINVRESLISLSGTAISILDKTVPAHKSFQVRIPLPDSLDEKGICGARISRNLRKQFAGGHIDGSHFVIETRVLGEFLITRDTVPPKIRILNRPYQQNYEGRSDLKIRIKDDFSGIDQYNCTIDGNWALLEYDAKNDLLICKFDKVPFLEKGDHELKIEVSDGAGNTNVVETKFRY